MFYGLIVDKEQHSPGGNRTRIAGSKDQCIAFMLRGRIRGEFEADNLYEGGDADNPRLSLVRGEEHRKLVTHRDSKLP